MRIAGLAARQFGVVARRQLTELGVSRGSIEWGLDTGYLFRVHPGVYAVGYVARSIESRLAAGVLYAGPGAMLSHRMGTWWLGLSDRRPWAIEISTPRRVASLPGVTVHDRRDLPRMWHNNLPVTTVAQTLLDLAALGTPDIRLRKVLAEADYRAWLDVDTLKAQLGRGIAGSTALRAALARHEPQLAMTRSELEDRMFALCERAGLPLPECNVKIEGLLVDAVWRAERVIVEVDGRQGHHTWAQIVRDRRREVVLRSARYVVLRYVSDQLRYEPGTVEADLWMALRPAA